MRFAKSRKEVERERVVGEKSEHGIKGKKEKVGRTGKMEQMQVKKNKER